MIISTVDINNEIEAKKAIKSIIIPFATGLQKKIVQEAIGKHSALKSYYAMLSVPGGQHPSSTIAPNYQQFSVSPESDIGKISSFSMKKTVHNNKID